MSGSWGTSLAGLLVLTFTGTAAVIATPAVASEEPGEGFSLELGRGVPGPASARAAGAQLVGATATFATRATGMPAAGSQPYQQLDPGAVLEVSYGYHWDTGILDYTFDVTPRSSGLRPDEAPEAFAGAGLGILDGSSCTIDTVDLSAVSRNLPERLLYGSGDATGTPNAGAWNCAALFVQDESGTITSDAYVSQLTVTTAEPQLSLKAPRKDRLVAGTWTEIPITVANAETSVVGARDVTVTGAGKGVKVKTLALDDLAAGSDASPYLWVKLMKPKAKLTVTVRELGSPVTTSNVKLSRRAAPARPLSGAYHGGGASFTVKAGKVRGFRISTATTCGGYPDLPTYSSNTYDFPTVGIPRNNEISRGDGGDQGSEADYSVHLRLTFVGRGKARGQFTYDGPARCRASDVFVVKRR